MPCPQKGTDKCRQDVLGWRKGSQFIYRQLFVLIEMVYSVRRKLSGILKFRDLNGAFLNFTKSIPAHTFAIFKYFAKQTIYSDSPDHMLKNDIQHV